MAINTIDLTDSQELMKLFINQISRQTGLGELDIANTLNSRGINHRGIGNPINQLYDQTGMIFMTRPNLCLSVGNLLAKRVLADLATDDEYSIPRMVRALLDPRANGTPNRPHNARRHNIVDVSTPLVDPRNPFLNILTNNLLSMTGWPDTDLRTYKSEEGISRQSWGMIDSIGEIYSDFTLTANLQNVPGDSITLLILTWLLYAGWVYRGELFPYPESIVEKEIDYTTRIYRFVMDPTRTYIQKYCACGYGFPTAISNGSSMEYAATQPRQDKAQQISVPFQCFGMTYNDPILLLEFNRLVKSFAPELAAAAAGNGNAYTRLDKDEVKEFNYHGLPLIDLDTKELEWWVPTEEYTHYKETGEFLDGHQIQ